MGAGAGPAAWSPLPRCRAFAKRRGLSWFGLAVDPLRERPTPGERRASQAAAPAWLCVCARTLRACRGAHPPPAPPRRVPMQAANLLLDDMGVVKIADFGVARVMDTGGIMTAETGTYR